MTDYNEEGIYMCVICRDEPMPHPGMTCSQCKRVRRPNPVNTNPWEVVR